MRVQIFGGGGRSGSPEFIQKLKTQCRELGAPLKVTNGSIGRTLSRGAGVAVVFCGHAKGWTAREQQDLAELVTLEASVLPVIEANQAELVAADHALNDHVRLMPTPGHTPDHFAVCAGRRGDQAVFTGDLVHSPIQARYPELVMRLDTDRAQGVATRRRFFERYCDTDTLCCTMHFPSPSAGHVKRWGDGFRLEYLE